MKPAMKRTVRNAIEQNSSTIVNSFCFVIKKIYSINRNIANGNFNF